MGGSKRKSLSASEKSQESSQPKSETKEKGKGKGQTQQKVKIRVLLDEKQGLGALTGLKAITPQALARNTGVKISVANAFLRSLESRGSVKRVGGYSGHRVYQLVEETATQVPES